MAEKPKIDRIGVNKVDSYFSLHGWLFREQPIHDYGIDAQVEIVKEGKPTGDLIAIQIKSGMSYFSESNAESIIFRTDNKHIEYWFRHSLPVILILYNLEDDNCYWQCVSEETVISSGKNWKIEIPKQRQLTKESLIEFCELTQPPSYIQKLNKLRLDKHWIKLLAEGETVYIEYEDWVNKTLPRFEIKIGCETNNGVEVETWPTVYGEIEEVIEHILPWADYEMDYDAHSEYMELKWHEECCTGYDDGEPFYYIPFSDWYSPPEESITHVSDNGETKGYRLILTLNEVGSAFFELDDYLSSDDVESVIFE